MDFKNFSQTKCYESFKNYNKKIKNKIMKYFSQNFKSKHSNC